MRLSLPQNRHATTPSWRQNWQDIPLMIVIALIAAIASYQGELLINPAFTWDKQLGDGWFNNDTTRTFDDMTAYAVDRYRMNLHPLFVILTMPIVYAIEIPFSLNPVTAVRLVMVGLTFLWFGCLFILFRVIGLRRFDATLFSLLAGISWD